MPDLPQTSLSIKTRILQALLFRIRPAFVLTFLKRVLSVRRTSVITQHGTFFIDPVSSFGMNLLGQGEFEPDMCRTLARYLEPSNVFIDVGANEGFFSIDGSKIVGTDGRVISIEPQSRLMPILKKNIEINGATNIKLVQAAITDSIGLKKLYISPDTNTGSTSFARPTRYKLPVEVVETLTLSKLFESSNIFEAELVKMDVEGWEFEAILGSSELFRDHRVNTIALELHPNIIRKRNLDPNTIFKFLIDCGYRIDERFDNLVFTVQ